MERHRIGRMDTIALTIMCVGVTVDAFIVSIAKGLAIRNVTLRPALTVGIWFGVFHALMTATGYIIGDYVYDYIKIFDEWIIFAVLVYIGGNLILDAYRGEEEDADVSLSSRKLAPLGFVLSLDALAVGISFAANNEDVVFGPAMIGMSAFILSTLGMYIGSRFGANRSKTAGYIGGVILIALAVWTVAENILLG